MNFKQLSLYWILKQDKPDTLSSRPEASLDRHQKRTSTLTPSAVQPEFPSTTTNTTVDYDVYNYCCTVTGFAIITKMEVIQNNKHGKNFPES